MQLTAGIDEAGRGPLAGPVVAAVVVLSDSHPIAGVRDSKKLVARRRMELAELIRNEACDWGLGVASVAEIDELNILGATLLAMRRAAEALSVLPDAVVVDGNVCPPLAAPLARITSALVRGDALCGAVAAASILAKVERDRMMDELHHRYPAYGFDRHRGYPTATHRAALTRWGVTPEHRMSFRPVRAAHEQSGMYCGD